MEWEAHVERGRGRYEDGARRLASNDPEARQKQLVRMAMAASAVGLALSMQGRPEATEWLSRSADRYRESFAGAPAGSWGRLIGALKARLLAGDRDGARADAAWALEQGPASSESPIGRYAAALAALVLDDDEAAGALASSLRAEPAEAFPRPVADALAALAARDGEAYAKAAKDTLTSFETRDDYLEDLPVADTVLALELLAEARGIRAGLRSPLLPA